MNNSFKRELFFWALPAIAITAVILFIFSYDYRTAVLAIGGVALFLFVGKDYQQTFYSQWREMVRAASVLIPFILLAISTIIDSWGLITQLPSIAIGAMQSVFFSVLSVWPLIVGGIIVVGLLIYFYPLLNSPVFGFDIEQSMRLLDGRFAKLAAWKISRRASWAQLSRATTSHPRLLLQKYLQRVSKTKPEMADVIKTLASCYYVWPNAEVLNAAEALLTNADVESLAKKMADSKVKSTSNYQGTDTLFKVTDEKSYPCLARLERAYQAEYTAKVRQLVTVRVDLAWYQIHGDQDLTLLERMAGLLTYRLFDGNLVETKQQFIYAKEKLVKVFNDLYQIYRTSNSDAEVKILARGVAGLLEEAVKLPVYEGTLSYLGHLAVLSTKDERFTQVIWEGLGADTGAFAKLAGGNWPTSVLEKHFPR